MLEEQGQEYISRALSIKSELNSVKDEYLDRLKGIKVFVDPVKNAELAKSVNQIFGDRSGTPNENFITFEMFRECLKIVRAGGKAKAAEYIKDKMV